MKITQSGIVYSGENTPSLSSCAFPSICKLKNGTLIASFKGAQTKGPYNKTDKGMTAISTDGGKTWSSPFEQFAPPVIDGKNTTIRTLYYAEISEDNLLAVFNAVDATMEELPYYNEETEGLKATYICTSHSTDGGKSWSPVNRVDVNTFKGMPLPLTGAPFITEDGRIGIQFEVNKHYYEKEYWVHHSAVVYSSDGGYTWGDEVVITDNPDIYYWDQRMDTMSDGRIVDVFWTFDRNKGDYINIHSTESTDGGRSFGELIDIGLSGQPGNVIDGKDGSMLLIYINRDKAPVIKIAESLDKGKSWKDVLTVFDYGADTKGKQNAGMNDVWAEMAAFATGHPYIERLDEGKALAYYYSGPSTHRTDFCYSIIEL